MMRETLVTGQAVERRRINGWDDVMFGDVFVSFAVFISLGVSLICSVCVCVCVCDLVYVGLGWTCKCLCTNLMLHFIMLCSVLCVRVGILYVYVYVMCLYYADVVQ